MEILKGLRQPLTCTIKDDDLEAVARETKGMTGADLQSLLYTAKLAKINGTEMHDDEANSDHGNNAYKYVKKESSWQVINADQNTVRIVKRANLDITMEELISALRNTRASLSTTELLKYQAMYEKSRLLMPQILFVFCLLFLVF